MGLKEIMAAKKAAALLEEKVTDVVAKPEAEVEAGAVTITPEISTMAELRKEEGAPVQVEKPLTFKERMALKNAQANAATVTAQASSTPSQNSDYASVETGKESEVPNQSASASQLVASAQAEASPLAPIPATEDTGTQRPVENLTEDKDDDASPEDRQAYADILQKIEALEALEEEKLRGAMTELKKALMQNPNAVQLMHDTDIGKMVIALRKLTREAQVEAAKEKATGRKKKEKTLVLSQEEVESIFNEL